MRQKELQKIVDAWIYQQTGDANECWSVQSKRRCDEDGDFAESEYVLLSGVIPIMTLGVGDGALRTASEFFTDPRHIDEARELLENHYFPVACLPF